MYFSNECQDMTLKNFPLQDQSDLESAIENYNISACGRKAAAKVFLVSQ